MERLCLLALRGGSLAPLGGRVDARAHKLDLLPVALALVRQVHLGLLGGRLRRLTLVRELSLQARLLRTSVGQARTARAPAIRRRTRPHMARDAGAVRAFFFGGGELMSAS